MPHPRLTTCIWRPIPEGLGANLPSPLPTDPIRLHCLPCRFGNVCDAPRDKE